MRDGLASLHCWPMECVATGRGQHPVCVPISRLTQPTPLVPCLAERWPLLLDPNLTALQWAKEREGKRGGLVCSRMGAPDLLRVMERAVAEVWLCQEGREGCNCMHANVPGYGDSRRACSSKAFMLQVSESVKLCRSLLQGHTLLIENMGESVDAVLMPVITRATYKKASRGASGTWLVILLLHKWLRLTCTTCFLPTSFPFLPAGPLAVREAGGKGGGVQQGVPPPPAHQGHQPSPWARAAGEWVLREWQMGCKGHARRLYLWTTRRAQLWVVTSKHLAHCCLFIQSCCCLAAQAETTLINFNVTEGGLEEALVALVVSRERADLEKAKAQLIVQVGFWVVCHGCCDGTRGPPCAAQY